MLPSFFSLLLHAVCKAERKEKRSTREDNMLKSHGRMKCWMAELEGKMDILHVKVKHMQDHPAPLSPTARAVRSLRAVNAVPYPSAAAGGAGGGGGEGSGAGAGKEGGIRVTQSEKSCHSIGDASLGMLKRKYLQAAFLFSFLYLSFYFSFRVHFDLA